jgi:CheY-like chemotaxis protein
VVVDVEGQRLVYEGEELSRGGIFVRMRGADPEVGKVVSLEVTFPGAEPVRLPARVAHVLKVHEARALGRYPGVGFQFTHSTPKIRGYFDKLVEETTPSADELLHSARVVMADPGTPLLVRLTNSLEGAAGFTVESVTNGADALVAAMEREPDAILAAADMPFMSGLELLRKLQAHDRLREVPFILLLDRESDLVRLEALRLGATDVIHKPFTDEELVIRLRRATLHRTAGESEANLRGTLGDISLGTLLSLLEFERKSGILVVNRGDDVARVMVSEGQVVRIEGPVDALEPLDRIMLVLDWADGNFEFSAAEISGDAEIQLSTQQLLLEHAKAVDEG